METRGSSDNSIDISKALFAHELRRRFQYLLHNISQMPYRLLHSMTSAEACILEVICHPGSYGTNHSVLKLTTSSVLMLAARESATYAWPARQRSYMPLVGWLAMSSDTFEIHSQSGDRLALTWLIRPHTKLCF